MEQPKGDSDIDVLARLGAAMLPPTKAETVTETAQQEAEASQDVQPQTEEEQPAQEAESSEDDGYVELELEGEVVRVPPKLKEGYLRQQDYTRKTQDLAKLQQQSLAVLQQQELVGKFNQETAAEQKELAQIKAELERYKSLDWTSIDTDTYIKTRGYIDQLKEKAGDIEKSLSSKASSVKQEIEQNRAKAASNAYEYIRQHVKDWAPDSDTEKAVASYANNFGVPPAALAEIAVRFPGFAVMAAKAQKYDSLQEGRTSAVQKVQKAPPIVKPGAVTSTKSSQEQAYKKTRAELRKTGSLEAATALFMQRMK